MKSSEVVFILDRSGSMANLIDDTIGGYNHLLLEQRREPGEVRVTTVTFSDSYQMLHDRVRLIEVPPMSTGEYAVGGMTALLDAIGRTISHIINVQRYSRPEERAGRVLFVIITDGHENASQEYRFPDIKAMIETQKERFGWEFLFLGANIDAIGTAAQLGIAPDRAVNYHADSRGTGLCYEAVSQTMFSVRAAAPIPADWKKDLEEDFRSRRKGR